MTLSAFDPAPADVSSRLGGFTLGAWLALLRVSIWQFVRGRRLLALAALFLLPSVLALLARYYNPNYDERIAATEEILIFYMVPQALVPLTGLVLASGMIRDEIEGQTITYLLIRPLPKWSIYTAKLLAAWVVSAGLSFVFVTATLAAIHWGAEGFWGTIIPARALQVSALSALSLLVYTALFGGLSLLVRWVLLFGVGYIVMFEGVFANIDFMVRRLTLLWYVRVLSERWLGLHVDSWTINLDEAPTGYEALGTLAGAALVLAVAAAWYFGRREIRVKTPEGN